MSVALTDRCSANDLGFIFQRSIPGGAAFIDWVLEDIGLRVFAGTLRDPAAMPFIDKKLGRREEPYSWEEIRRTIFVCSHYKWAPSAEVLQTLVMRDQADQEEQAA